MLQKRKASPQDQVISDNKMLQQNKPKAGQTELHSMMRDVACISYRNVHHAKSDRNMMKQKD